jgi:HK97 family phage portal protein
MKLLERVRRRAPVTAPQLDAPPAEPERAGFEYGVPPMGATAEMQGFGAATNTDRRSMLATYYDAYLTCPWAWSSVSAIGRTITAGGLVTDWDADSGEGDAPQPDKPPEVLALERLLAFTNPRDDIRQLIRRVVTDLLVFGDAFVEIVRFLGIPIALYNLDCPTMYIEADPHGTVTRYVQVTEYGQRANFEPDDVIHIRIDTSRSGLYGTSPTQAALLPITSWLFAAANAKEYYRKGAPPLIHVDMPAGMSNAEIKRWYAQYHQTNLGPRNLGSPIVTKGGASITELAQARLVDNITYLDQKRDEILASYGVPPAKGGVIEAGHLGAGTGEAQDKTFKINTCAPIAELILEKFNYQLVRRGFRITGWHLKFGDIDYRDSSIIENIRDQRLRNGSWTLNRYRAEIGEPPVPGGDDAVLVDRQNLVLWREMAAMSEAMVLAKRSGAVSAQDPAINSSPGDAIDGPAPLTDLGQDAEDDGAEDE